MTLQERQKREIERLTDEIEVLERAYSLCSYTPTKAGVWSVIYDKKQALSTVKSDPEKYFIDEEE